MTKEEMRQWIDKTTYTQLLGHWRFAEVGDPFFRGEMGDYYSKKLAEKKAEVGNAAHVQASKTLGWER